MHPYITVQYKITLSTSEPYFKVLKLGIDLGFSININLLLVYHVVFCQYYQE